MLRALYRSWKTSPKKAVVIVQTGHAIDDKAHALKGLHGIRWLLSKTSAVVALAKSWHVQVAGLHAEIVNADGVLRQFEKGISLATHNADLIGV